MSDNAMIVAVVSIAFAPFLLAGLIAFLPDIAESIICTIEKIKRHRSRRG